MEDPNCALHRLKIVEDGTFIFDLDSIKIVLGHRSSTRQVQSIRKMWLEMLTTKFTVHTTNIKIPISLLLTMGWIHHKIWEYHQVHYPDKRWKFSEIEDEVHAVWCFSTFDSIKKFNKKRTILCSTNSCQCASVERVSFVRQ